MWLPHHWRSSWNFRRWSGRFLGLVHEELPEIDILECPELPSRQGFSPFPPYASTPSFL